MRRVVLAALLLLALGSVVPALTVQAASAPGISVNSQYVINRYGFAIINETVALSNNGSSAIQVPDIQFGFGSLSSAIMGYNVTGAGYVASASQGPQGKAYVVSGGGQTIQPGANSTFSLKAVTDDVASKTKNGTLAVETLTMPYLSVTANTLKLTIRMPHSTQFAATPPGYKESYTGTNVTYYQTLTDASPQKATTQSSYIKQYSGQDFFPLAVYAAQRVITVSPDGTPMVKDSLSLGNLGTTQLSTLYILPLAQPGSKLTVVPSASPPLLNPTTVSLSNGGIGLSSSTVSLAIDPGANLTITYEYPLARGYYNVSGATVSISIPESPPIRTYVDSFEIKMSAPAGIAGNGAAQSLGGVGPFNQGLAKFSYSLSIAWGLNDGLPLASFIFVVLLIGLYAARAVGLGEEEEEEEESATKLSSDMVKAFEEKTSLINGLFEEIPTVDPNQLNKAYFDELRGRLDTFRGRALQRLNEMRQKSVSRKFSDLLGQIHETEREVDRASRDMLNLYDQFYTRRMRKEVFDRLLPNYRKRLEKALNQLSDELNLAQRESKLL